jgi:hypothetical protein
MYCLRNACICLLQMKAIIALVVVVLLLIIISEYQPEQHVIVLVKNITTRIQLIALNTHLSLSLSSGDLAVSLVFRQDEEESLNPSPLPPILLHKVLHTS